MPGSKRKLDEDTWLIFQSKKCKTNQLSESIFECTLAKLRHGSRSFFSPQILSTSSNRTNAISGSGSGSSIASEMIKCNDCQQNRADGATMRDQCNFCDKRPCHLNRCKSCSHDFCNNCSIRRYDDPMTDAFTCIGCLP